MTETNKTPIDNLIDTFMASETLVVSIKTPSREVVRQLLGAAMQRDHTFPFEVTGLSFDVELVRSADYKVIAEALESLNTLQQLSIDKTSLQLQ